MYCQSDCIRTHARLFLLIFVLFTHFYCKHIFVQSIGLPRRIIFKLDGAVYDIRFSYVCL